MTTEISRFLSAQTTEHQRLNIVYKMVVAHIWNDIQQTNQPMLYWFFPPFFFLHEKHASSTQSNLGQTANIVLWINASLQTLRPWSNWVWATARGRKNGESEISGRPSRGKWHQRMIPQPSFCNAMGFLSLSVVVVVMEGHMLQLIPSTSPHHHSSHCPLQ